MKPEEIQNRKANLELGTVTQAYNPSVQEAEAGEMLV